MPSVSRLLDRTGEFYRNTQRRYDGTALRVAERCECGYESRRGKDALERMNWAHRHYRIANDGNLYALPAFVFDPIRWIDSFAWRATCRNEQLGYCCVWREVGNHMGINDIPASYEALEQWARAMVRLRGQFTRWLPPRKEPHCFTGEPSRSRPRGYEINRLGAPRLIEGEARRRQADGASAPGPPVA